MFGLKDELIVQIIEVLKNCEGLYKAVVFGSRALGNCKSGSDVDIAYFCVNLCNSEEILKQINEELNEASTLPYEFDIVDYNGIENEALKEHILEKGIVIWERKL